MSDRADFIIENGVLKKYVGKGVDVIVPDAVTEIGSNVFNKQTTDRYDPFYIIKERLYEERSETVEYQTEERQYITVKAEADYISSEILIKRLKFLQKQ